MKIKQRFILGFMALTLMSGSVLAQQVDEDKVDQAMRILKNHHGSNKLLIGSGLGTLGGALIYVIGKTNSNWNSKIDRVFNGLSKEITNQIIENKNLIIKNFVERASENLSKMFSDDSRSVSPNYYRSMVEQLVDGSFALDAKNQGKMLNEFEIKNLNFLNKFKEGRDSFSVMTFQESMNAYTKICKSINEYGYEKAIDLFRAVEGSEKIGGALDQYGSTQEGIQSYVKEMKMILDKNQKTFFVMERTGKYITYLGAAFLGLSVVAKIFHKEDPSVGVMERIENMTLPEVYRLLVKNPELVEMINAQGNS